MTPFTTLILFHQYVLLIIALTRTQTATAAFLPPRVTAAPGAQGKGTIVGPPPFWNYLSSQAYTSYIVLASRSTATTTVSPLILRASDNHDDVNHNNNNKESIPSSSSTTIENDGESPNQDQLLNDKKARFVQGLLDNLANVLDRWILSGNPSYVDRAQNVLQQIEQQSQDDPESIQRALRLIRRAGMPLPRSDSRQAYPDSTSSKKELGRTDHVARRNEAEERKRWEASRTQESSSGRSALRRRAAANPNGKPDVLIGGLDESLDPRTVAQDKKDLEQALRQDGASPQQNSLPLYSSQQQPADVAAAAKVSAIVARTGGGSSFDGESLGIGGLDDVLSQVRRRVWIPLAAPPQLLDELGIHPVRGLLLYGRPGCGKTLLARQLGSLLSPMRPITVVSGPEVLDKFVGSSEKNLRAIFDEPPDIYDGYRIGESDGGAAMARSALHVIILDEFDAIARTRGGRGGKGDQGDAGVARDSVVNQLLAKMDGVDPLVVPTLVIGLTNKRSLIEPALLRAGRFEVQIEVPPPKTVEQRISIFQVHTRHMHEAGRLLVRDAPIGSAASKMASHHKVDLPTHDELLLRLAVECDGFSGASIAGVCRAAASHALERAVEELSQASDLERNRSLLDECVVVEGDFDAAIADVKAGLGDSDWEEDK